MDTYPANVLNEIVNKLTIPTCRKFMETNKRLAFIMEPMFKNKLDKVKIGCGNVHTVILYDDPKSVIVFGSNKKGQLGFGHHNNIMTPQKLRLRKAITDVSCGVDHTVLLCEDGTLYVFGSNRFGQLGLGHNEEQSKPVNLELDKKAVKIACGHSHTIVMCDDNTIYGFGHNTWGELGLGHTDDINKPTELRFPKENIVSIDCSYHTAVLYEDCVYFTGNNTFGQFGCCYDDMNCDKVDPIKFQLDKKITGVSCGEYCTVLICEDGTILTSGYGYEGQLGLGNNDEHYSFEPIELNKKPVKTRGIRHNMVLCEDGTVYGFGKNDFGQLGLMSSVNTPPNLFLNVRYSLTSSVNTPQKLLFDKKIINVSCGFEHTIILCDDGEMYSFGCNDEGQLGLANLPLGVAHNGVDMGHENTITIAKIVHI